VAQPYYVYSTNFRVGRMSVSIYLKGYYEEFYALKAARKQSQFKANRRPLAGNPKLEILNPKKEIGADNNIKL